MLEASSSTIRTLRVSVSRTPSDWTRDAMWASELTGASAIGLRRIGPPCLDLRHFVLVLVSVSVSVLDRLLARQRLVVPGPRLGRTHRAQKLVEVGLALDEVDVAGVDDDQRRVLVAMEEIAVGA